VHRKLKVIVETSNHCIEDPAVIERILASEISSELAAANWGYVPAAEVSTSVRGE
jgi:hypothetical protein